MRLSRGWHVGVLALWVAGTGCTALREIPRAEYVEQVPRRAVRVVTRGGVSYELETARIQADSLMGYRNRDVGGPVEEFDMVRLPLEDVASISARRLDWYRTGLVGVTVAVAVGVGVARSRSDPSPTPGGGGKEPPPLP
jgi:hypothetical protein